jgi:HNH endonuclease/NUMOD4 motif
MYNTYMDNTVLTSQEHLMPVIGFESRYLVSNLGYVRNHTRVLKCYTINSGYQCIKLTSCGVKTTFLLHRLVATHFINNPLFKPEVNHMDGDKSNCSASNLEWVSSEENKAHAISTGLWVYNKPSIGVKLGKSSKYHNVIWDKSRGKWIGTVRHNNVNQFPKRFDSEEDAALHVNWIIDNLGLTDRVRNFL